MASSSREADRVRELEKARYEKRRAFEEKKQGLTRHSPQLKAMSDAFMERDGRTETAFKACTVGLVSAQEFKRKREEAELLVKAQKAAEAEAKERERRRRAEERKRARQVLSFGDGGEDAEDEEEEAFVPKKKQKKDPTVESHFLPDAQREAEEVLLTKALEEEWRRKQEETKKETVEITYSYWDGSGHRKVVKVTKGTTIRAFLEQCRQDLSPAFHELRAVAPDNLMYVKEDLIIPGNFTFFELIALRARGKTGPLFRFDAREDVRVVGDATVARDESHAGKVVTRAYYERNKHVWPCNNWEVFDPVTNKQKYGSNSK